MTKKVEISAELHTTEYTVLKHQKLFKDFSERKYHFIDPYDALSIYNKGIAKIQTKNSRSYPI